MLQSRSTISNPMKPVDYIPCETFENLKLKEINEELEATELYEMDPGDLTETTSDLPRYIAKMYTIPLLSNKGEQLLFKKMNFLRYSADQIHLKRKGKKVGLHQTRKYNSYLSEADTIQKQIIEANLRLAFSIARKFSGGKISFDDLVSEANLILLKAVRKFDYSKGFRFSTYATHSIQRHIYGLMKKTQRKDKKEVNTSETILRETVIATDQDIDIHTEEKVKMLLTNMGHNLEEREQHIIRERFGFNKTGKTRTLQSLSDDLGLCKERVRQLHHKALEKLKGLAQELNIEPVIN